MDALTIFIIFVIVLVFPAYAYVVSKLIAAGKIKAFDEYLYKAAKIFEGMIEDAKRNQESKRETPKS